jgi:peptidoglycan/LPS O-acetylase OafA/YrhL
MYMQEVAHEKGTSAQKNLPLRVLLTFVVTVVVARALVFFTPDWFHIEVNDTHIHHLMWGILILALCGCLNLVYSDKKWRTWLALLYGVGLALTFDEFAMWIKLTTNYWSWLSYSAVLVIAILLLIATGVSALEQPHSKQ